MNTKHCNGCGLVKETSEFHKEARAKNGLKPRCKECTNKYYREKYPDFRQSKLDGMKKSYQSMPALFKRRRKEYYAKNKESILLKAKDYPKDKESRRAYMREYCKKRNVNDPDFRMGRLIRSLIPRLFRVKGSGVENILGYKKEDLIKHLGRYPLETESLDHRIPISWFLEGTKSSVIHALPNIQILDKRENSRKNNFTCDAVPFEYLEQITESIKPEYRSLLKSKP